MIPAVYNNYQESGLNGKFGAWLKRKIKKIINIIEDIPIVGPIVAEVVDLVMTEVTGNYGEGNPDSWWNYSGRALIEYEPTISEQQILDAWADGKLQPFYKKLAEDVSAALRSSDFNQQVRGVNAGLSKMCIARYHFTHNEKSGLSPNAVTLRLQLLDEIFMPIEKLISDSLSASNLVMADVNVTANFSEYAPLISSSSATVFSCENYLGGNTVQNQSFLPAGTTATFLLPDKIIKPVNPVVKLPAVTGNTPKEAADNGWGGKLLVGGLFLAGILVLLSGGKKKKNES